MSICSYPGYKNFNDSSKFMELEDGRIAYKTNRKTWSDIVLHGLSLDDYFYAQNIKPTVHIPYEPLPKKQKKKKEGLNDGNKCDFCKEEMDTVYFCYGEILCTKCCYNKKEHIKNSVCDCCGNFTSGGVMIKVRISWEYNEDSNFRNLCGPCYFMECCRLCGSWSGDSLCEACRYYNMF